MQIQLTNTLSKRKPVFALLCMTLVACSPAGPAKSEPATMAERLAKFAEDCGFNVSLPTSEADLRALIEQHHADSYDVAPSIGGRSGDNVFPLTMTPEIGQQGNVVSAIVVKCQGVGNPQSLGYRSPRHAFYVDERGTVFHIEEHSLYLG